MIVEHTVVYNYEVEGKLYLVFLFFTNRNLKSVTCICNQPFCVNIVPQYFSVHLSESEYEFLNLAPDSLLDLDLDFGSSPIKIVYCSPCFTFLLSPSIFFTFFHHYVLSSTQFFSSALTCFPDPAAKYIQSMKPSPHLHSITKGCPVKRFSLLNCGSPKLL